MKRLHWILIAIPLALGAVASTAQTSAPPPDAAHSSRNALDWAGTYEGELPCAGCPGVQTRLTLRRDESYEWSSQDIERDRQPHVVAGRFTWQASGNAITLDAAGGGRQFAVGEGRIALLEPGATPSWEGPQRVLQRVAAVGGADVQRMLEAHRWTLVAASDAKGQAIAGLPAGAGRPVVFSFADGRIAFEGGCNRGFGGYRIESDGRLRAGRMASTMMACEPAAMKVDAALAELMAQPLTIEMTAGAAPALTLVTPTRTSLSFTGRMTPEARYGAPSRIFLEVGAQTVACTNPLNGATTCLQAREHQFDAQGLKVGTPGAWQPFYDSIEGYTHQPGVRNVLRLKRFDRGAAAGAPRYLYVLDLVVESEVVQR